MAVAVTGDARKRRALYGVMLSVFLAAMESTVVATAMPTVVASLGGVHIYSWVFSGFLLTSTVTMPLWGRVSDLFGRRPVYLGGLGIFLLGSALSGASQDMVQLIGFRMLQGLGAGSLMTLGMTMIGELFGLEQRARMQGYVSGMWGVASLLGPLLGGLLTDLGSWRWVFYVNLPFGAVAIALLAGALPDATVRRPHAFDWTGVALFTSGISALLVGILEAGRIGVWTGADVLVPLALAAVALAAFVPVERRAGEPIVPFRLFRHRMVLAAGVNGFLSGLAMLGAGRPRRRDVADAVFAHDRRRRGTLGDGGGDGAPARERVADGRGPARCVRGGLRRQRARARLRVPRAGGTCPGAGAPGHARGADAGRRIGGRHARRRPVTRSPRPADAGACGRGGLARRAPGRAERRSRHRAALRHRRRGGHRRQPAGARGVAGAGAEGRADLLRGAARGAEGHLERRRAGRGRGPAARGRATAGRPADPAAEALPHPWLRGREPRVGARVAGGPVHAGCAARPAVRRAAALRAAGDGRRARGRADEGIAISRSAAGFPGRVGVRSRRPFDGRGEPAMARWGSGGHIGAPSQEGSLCTSTSATRRRSGSTA